jgi:hypothetical protein
VLEGIDEAGRELVIADPAAATLRSLGRSGSTADVLREAGRVSGVLPRAVLDDRELMGVLAQLYDDLDRHGVRATCRGLSGSSPA